MGLVLQMPPSAHPQPAPHGEHGMRTLFVAALEGQHVVPAVATDASGTGAFTLNGEGGRMAIAYDLTYQALPKPPRRIVLRNFGEGGVGKVVHVICGEASPCPQQAGATLKGEWTDRDVALPLTAALAREAAVGRVYAQIEDEAGQGVVRGQITTYDTMLPVQGFIARLRPRSGAASADAASGTGAFFLAQAPGGGQAMAYQVTIAGTEGAPTKALIVASAAAGPGAAPRAGAPLQPLVEALPQRLPPRMAAEPAPGTGERKGGTIAGEIAPPRAGAVILDRHTRTANAPGAPAGAEKLSVIIATEADPNGELIGELTPVE